MKRFWFLVALLLAGCGGGGGTSNQRAAYPIPAPGQWACGWCKTATNNLGATFAMQPAPGIHYVYTPAAGLALGKTVTLTYTLSGNAVLTHDDPSDIDPPTISLFIWQRGDDLSCAGVMAGYRQFLTARPNLEFGTHTVSAVLSAPNWTGCYPGQAAAAFNNAVANAAYMGFTLSGQYFAGHGVDVKSGSATFTINGFTVQ